MEAILARDMVKEYTASYASYVATNRSVPSLLDGLKPVQRRCINAANDLKLYHNKKHMKVSKLSGDVMGSYHPHGGANPVLMAQPFRFRYPIFDGQGNYGSPDMPDSYAAARYLEIRLSKFCEDFYLNSADYADKEENYDGRLKEITQYYPALPGCLFTGASGIAVGFSTEVPPHTITDIGNSLLAYMKNPSSTKYLDNLYPETCEKSIVLTPLPEIRKLYETGEGSVRYKASTHYETVNGKPSLIVDAFPPGFSKKRLETPSIMDAVDKGLLEVSNESAETIRYVFTSPDKSILESLEERLTSSVGYRMYIEHRGVIKLYKLSEIYDTFLEERSAYIIRKYKSLVEEVSSNHEYLRVLLLLKNDKKYIKDMFDKDSTLVLSEMCERYKTTMSIAKKVISASLKSLMVDNLEAIKEQMEDITKKISEYQSYIDNPIERIEYDIKTLMKDYTLDKKRATLVTDTTSSYEVNYRGKKLIIDNNTQYILGNSSNDIKLVYGSDILSVENLDDYILCPATSNFYFFYDNKGCCSVTHETLISKGNKFNSAELLGILGTNDLSTIHIKQGNGKVYKGVNWSLRQKSAYICLSKEDEPNFCVVNY